MNQDQQKTDKDYPGISVRVGRSLINYHVNKRVNGTRLDSMIQSTQRHENQIIVSMAYEK